MYRINIIQTLSKRDALRRFPNAKGVIGGYVVVDNGEQYIMLLRIVRGVKIMTDMREWALKNFSQTYNTVMVMTQSYMIVQYGVDATIDQGKAINANGYYLILK